jgi:hypothetical protein
MWIVDIVLVLMVVAELFQKEKPTEDSATEEQPPLPTCMEKVEALLSILLFVLFQVFLMMRMDQDIAWSWFAVFSPWFAMMFLDICVLFKPAFIDTHVMPDVEGIVAAAVMEEGESSTDSVLLHAKIEALNKYYHGLNEQADASKSIFNGCLFAWLAVFLALKLDCSVGWNWGLVFLPVWVYIFIGWAWAHWRKRQGEALIRSLDPASVALAAEGELKDPKAIAALMQGSELIQSNSFLAVLGKFSALIFVAILLTCRLQVSTAHYSTFIIILPVFVTIGCCCCFVFCGLCCFSSVDLNDFDDAVALQQQQNRDKHENSDAESADATANPAFDGEKSGTVLPNDQPQQRAEGGHHLVNNDTASSPLLQNQHIGGTTEQRVRTESGNVDID